MPFDIDPNYTTETEVKHPSLEGLAAWLRTQEPETEYEGGDIYDCLLCRYFRAAGVPFKAMGIWTYSTQNRAVARLPAGLNNIANPPLGRGGLNYRDALARCEAALESRS